VFTKDDLHQIAVSLKRSAERLSETAI